MFTLMQQHQRIEALQTRVQGLSELVNSNWATGVDVGPALAAEVHARIELQNLRLRYSIRVPRA